MKKCIKCGGEFEPKNPKGRFCSDKCRVYWNRGKNKPQEVVVKNHTQPTTMPQSWQKKPLKNESVNTTQKVYTIEMCEEELMTLGDGQFARQRREFLRKKVLELLNNK